jgi:hypothetical protein
MADPVSNLTEKMKTGLSEDEQKLLDKLMADAAAFAKAADSDGDGKPDAAGVKRLFMKDGDFSKTSAILVMSWFAGVGMWVVQGLFHGMVVPGLGLTIPPFDATAALTMLGAASSLYMATHNIKVNLGAAPASDAEKAGG